MAQYKSQGRIDKVVPGSPAARVGIAAGDRLVAINDMPVKDVVGYQFHQVNSRVTVQVEREGVSAPLVFTLRKPEQQDLGLEFVDPTFDGIKRCNNHCPFCFVDQNAPGLRRTLDIKDDDLRYSFLYGGFITLTNLRESDWQRVQDEALSPLYVSVHATELELRRELLGNPRAPQVLDQLKRLGDMNVQVHTQLVLCPGINDGEHLDRSIADLVALYPHVQTVGAVPVGLTKFRATSDESKVESTKLKEEDELLSTFPSELSTRRERSRHGLYQSKLDLRPYTRTEASAVLDQVEAWQGRLHRGIGTHFVFASDEWYIMAGREVPHKRHYENFSQLENGIGMVRQLLDESKRTARKLPASIERPLRVVVACGEMPAASLNRSLEPLRAIENLDVQMVVVKNMTLEGNVACSGLLFGEEVAARLRKQGLNGRSGVRGQGPDGYEGAAGKGDQPSNTLTPDLSDLVFLPRRMFDFQGIRTLDEWTIERFQDELGVPCIKAEWTYEIWNTVQRALAGGDVRSRTDEGARLSALG